MNINITPHNNIKIFNSLMNNIKHIILKKIKLKIIELYIFLIISFSNRVERKY